MSNAVGLQQLLVSRSPLSSIFITSCIISFAFVVIRSVFRAREDDPTIPLYVPESTAAGNYRKRWSYDNPKALREAYRKFPDVLFKIWTSQGNQLALPARYLDELKMLPDAKFASSLRTFFLGPYLWPVEQWKLDYVQKGLHRDLNKHLPTMFLEAKEGVDNLIPLEFSDFKDWSPVTVYPRILKLVSRVNTKILIGNGLQENDEWIDISASYTRNIFVSSAKLRIFHPILRPLAQFFIPELRSVWDCNRRARDLLAPILANRAVQERSTDYKKPVDSVEWVRDDAIHPNDKNDPHLHAIVQLIIGALSVNTTSQLITNSIFNLAAWPENLPILRQEINDVWKEVDGEWTMDSMVQLQKLDSFVKETLRHSGHLTLTFQRMAHKPVTLSDGVTIPDGFTVFAPANAINFDPKLYPDPETFDALRFYKLRHSAPENEKKYQLTSTTKEQMQFGLGRHACPGRYIASHQVKLILVHLISKYDFRLKNGEGRPKTILFQTNQFPDPKGEIEFKSRE